MHIRVTYGARSCSYVRLLSGFLDKVVIKPGQDWDTLGYISQQLGLEPGVGMQATREDFERFVQRVQRRGVEEVNEHLRLQVLTCDKDIVKYGYRFRLEEVCSNSNPTSLLFECLSAATTGHLTTVRHRHCTATFTLCACACPEPHRLRIAGVSTRD